MINKIKDKQTGEYHDIGGLKCKLVAEGILEYDEGVEFYQGFYNFKANKGYLIEIAVTDNNKIGLFGFCFRDNVILTNMTFDPYNICTTIYLHQFDMDEAYFSTASDDVIGDYNGCSYKVYELPFVLEV